MLAIVRCHHEPARWRSGSGREFARRRAAGCGRARKSPTGEPGWPMGRCPWAIKADTSTGSPLNCAAGRFPRALLWTTSAGAPSACDQITLGCSPCGRIFWRAAEAPPPGTPANNAADAGIPFQFTAAAAGAVVLSADGCGTRVHGRWPVPRTPRARGVAIAGASRRVSLMPYGPTFTNGATAGTGPAPCSRRRTALALRSWCSRTAACTRIARCMSCSSARSAHSAWNRRVRAARYA